MLGLSSCKKRRQNLIRNFSDKIFELTDYRATIYYPNDSIVTLIGGIDYCYLDFVATQNHGCQLTFKVSDSEHYRSRTTFYYWAHGGIKIDTSSYYKEHSKSVFVSYPGETRNKVQMEFILNSTLFKLTKPFDKRDTEFEATHLVSIFSNESTILPDSIRETYIFKEME
ncbi:MAG: hypothetical protein N4A41_11665 [Crocinitomicaceae bacterium]|jgi:hypothetical protein|nr:hypothetical protein [Crocinitomicaceae bacterium]